MENGLQGHLPPRNDLTDYWPWIVIISKEGLLRYMGCSGVEALCVCFGFPGWLEGRDGVGDRARFPVL